jgi:predicted permease
MPIDRWFTRTRLRLRSIFLGNRVDDELDEELRFHLEQQVEANLAAGMTADEARHAALRQFGGIEQHKEESRDMRGVSWLIDIVRDLRHGVRLLARSPMFATAAVLSLGIGIGANVSMFSIVDALLLRKLPVAQPDGLVYLVSTEKDFRSSELSFEIYQRLREKVPPFAELAALWHMERANVSVDGAAGDLGGASTTRMTLVTGGYFAMHGVNAAIGRTLTDADNGGRAVVVVSDRFWRTRLHADPDATSRTLRLNGFTFDIVGVTPAGFSGEWVGVPTEVWVPFALASKVMPELPQGPRAFPARVFARLAPGWTIAETTAAVSTMLKQANIEDLTAHGVHVSEPDAARMAGVVVDASRGYSPQRTVFRPSLLILMSGVALLLVVACANLANLLMARSSTRQRELAVRLAVGAGRGRIARQMLTECLLIASLGGAAGLAIAVWATHVLSSQMAAAPVSLAGQSNGLLLDLRIDPRILAFAIALCFITAILSGLAPALAAQRIAPASALRANRTLGLGRFGGPSSVLLIAQVAVSLVLLIGAGLFIASLRNLRTEDLGLGREHELFVWTVPGQIGVRDDAMVDLWRRIQEQLSSIPGVAAVGASNQAVLNGGINVNNRSSVLLTVVGEPPKATTQGGGRVFVMPGFFEAAGIRLVAGRDFTERDRDSSANVAILNASMARFYFGSEAAAVGRMVIFPGPVAQPHEIVGVVRDFVRTSPRQGYAEFSNFFPYRHQEAINRGQQSRLRVMLIAIRVTGDPLAIADTVRSKMREIDPMLPVLRINTTEQQLDDVLAQDRLVTSLSAALSAIAVFLASLGLFGLLAYRVARRTNEIGVRLAFGATRGSVLRMVLGESGRLVAVGLVVGVVAAAMLARYVSSRLYGISATDPLTIAGAMLVLTIVAAVAAWIPARQAATVDPSVALRCD